MFTRIVFLACFPALFLMTSPIKNETAKFTVGFPPAWVQECDFAVEPIPVKPSQVNFQHLLTDIQHNWEEHTRYYHMAIKVLNQAGAEKISQFTIDFDPSYQTVVVHTLQVIRDGKKLDRLKHSRHKLLQREEDLERNLYNGDYTLVYFLNDVRVGDIIEYAWSIVGAHQLFSSHLTDMVMLQNQATVERIYRRILIHPDRYFSLKTFNTDQEPRVKDLSPTLREWSWEAVETAASPIDPWQPSWHNPLARVQISQYENWHDVIEKIIPLFSLSEEFKSAPPSDMVALVSAWKELSDPSARALHALRFVQDEIRYLGFEDGLGSHKSTDPYTVFPSTPLLVHSAIGRNLPNYLPTPNIFNHAILRIELEGAVYFVDPTITLQGGTLQDNYFPNLEWGLPISENTTALIPLPVPSIQKTVTIDTTILLNSPDSAEIKSQWIHSGSKADSMRKMISRKGLKKISEGYLNDVQKQYKGASILSPLTISDDRDRNLLTITESYKVPTRTRRGSKFLKATSQVIAIYLDNDLNLERNSPYLLAFPHWVTEHIHIESPSNDWLLDAENLTLEHESIYYNHNMKKEGSSIDLNFEVKHLKDHVPVQGIREYWNMVSELELNPSLEVMIHQPPKSQLKAAH
jgi:hypothetical protein